MFTILVNVTIASENTIRIVRFAELFSQVPLKLLHEYFEPKTF